jgi:hypothetical protein
MEATPVSEDEIDALALGQLHTASVDVVPATMSCPTSHVL